MQFVGLAAIILFTMHMRVSVEHSHIRNTYTYLLFKCKSLKIYKVYRVNIIDFVGIILWTEISLLDIE